MPIKDIIIEQIFIVIQNIYESRIQSCYFKNIFDFNNYFPENDALIFYRAFEDKFVCMSIFI